MNSYHIPLNFRDINTFDNVGFAKCQGTSKTFFQKLFTENGINANDPKYEQLILASNSFHHNISFVFSKKENLDSLIPSFVSRNSPEFSFKCSISVEYRFNIL